LLLLEPYIAEKATLAITQEDLNRLEKLIKDSEHAIKHDIAFESRKYEIEFHRIIGSITGNPILMFILDFVENLLIDTKAILKPGKEFSAKVLRAHKRIFNALLERNIFIPAFGGKDNEIFKYSKLIWEKYTENDNIKCPYTLDGLIYHPLDQKYILSVKDSKFIEYKWKPEDKNSIDWEIKDVLKYLGIKYYIFGIEKVN
jgi:hypothetical protein